MKILRGCVLSITALCVFGVFVYAAAESRAAGVSWLNAPISIDQQDDSINGFTLSNRNCKFQDNVPIKGVGLAPACVATGTKLKFAYSGSEVYAAKGRDQTFYPLAITNAYLVLTPDSDRVTGYMSAGVNTSTFAVYEDASSRLSHIDGHYVFRTSQPSFQYQKAARFYTLPQLSAGGGFAAYVSTNANGTQLAVKTVNLNTGVTTSIGYVVDWASYLQETLRNIAVSEDGQYVAINTMAKSEDNRTFRTIQVWSNKDCDVDAGVACETRLATENVPHIGTPAGLEFNDNATTVTIMNYESIPQADEYNYFRTSFSIPDLFRGRQLDYLAMGDSYSSGEGDGAATGSHYLSGTDVLGDAMNPSERCHVSNRSYPFLLHKWLMADTKMRSVACSGAVVARDYIGSEWGYKGQNYRLAGVSGVMASQMKQDALDISFIPGRNKQISFVKKYQPKAVTITGGGNDVGFSKTITKCADPTNTCSEATSLLKISQLGWSIRSQYDPLMRLYKDIHDKSPKTKIYVVGYPQFVSARDVTCAANVGLDTTERKLVREGVVMMNDVIEAAANAAGVKYVDIESSLGDAVLCGEAKTEYVNGIAVNTPWNQMRGEGFFSNESFHPDAMGHHVMAGAIQAVVGNKSPIEYSYCRGSATTCPKNSPPPPLTDFFKLIDTIPLKWIGESFAQVTIQPLVNSTLRISTNGLGQGSATVRMESTPRTLGVVAVGEDGTLDANLTVPTDVEPGIHTLYIDTFSPAGEPITLWQHITVLGRDGDVDGNGVDDALQPCPFVVGDVQDSDSDGVDDRCDSKINSEDSAEAQTLAVHQSAAEVPRVSNFASVAVKKFLQSESQRTVEQILGYSADAAAVTLLDQDSSVKRQVHRETDSLSDKSMPTTNNRTVLTNLSIIVFVVVCMVVLTGFLYVKTHPKKP